MRVGLFVPCLVDLMRPSIGSAAIRLIEAGGADVSVPLTQTCCGQPAYNAGNVTRPEGMIRTLPFGSGWAKAGVPGPAGRTLRGLYRARQAARLKPR